MSFSQIRTLNFRNLENNVIDLQAPEVFLVGENGQGKTNFLEAVYTLCYGNSFRTHVGGHMIMGDEDSMGLLGQYSNREQPDTIRFTYAKKKKTISINDKPVKDRKELIQRFPCIVFCHDDIQFVNGPPDRRRWFLNQTMSLFDPLFVDLLRKYNLVLLNRNTALKQKVYDLLDVYDHQLSEMGVLLQSQRDKTIVEFNKTFTELYKDIAGIDGDVSIQYRPNWPADGGIEEAQTALSEGRRKDIVMGTTTSGPHRDNFLFRYKRQNFVHIASTGQQRLLSLILRVAQAHFFHSKTGRSPLLLLDDVLLELDLGKRKKFVRLMPPYRQAFFTFLPDEPYTDYAGKETLFYRVQNGRFTRESVSR